jgi:hypothetical protein
MLSLLADENFNGDVVEGLRRKRPDIDLITVQEAALFGMDDPNLLEWSAQEGRILLSHDFKTISNYAYERVSQDLPMPGVLLIHATVPIGVAIEALLVYVDTSDTIQWANQVEYVRP